MPTVHKEAIISPNFHRRSLNMIYMHAGDAASPRPGRRLSGVGRQGSEMWPPAGTSMAASVSDVPGIAVIKGKVLEGPGTTSAHPQQGRECGAC